MHLSTNTGSVKNADTMKERAPLMFVSGGVWRMGREYFVERRNYNNYLLLYTISGEGRLGYEGKEYRLLPGMVFLIDCRQPQQYGTSSELWEFAFVHFDTDCLQEYVDTLYQQFGAVFYPADGRQLESRMREVIALFQGYHRGASHEAFGLLAQLLGMLYACSEEHAADQRISEDTTRILQLIEAQYHEKLTLEKIARKIGHSKYYLEHRFKTDMGMPVYGYLTLYRISRSRLLLQNTNLAVAEVAEQVGFTGVSNFIRTFSEYEGMTPHQYRKQWR